jgi:hypothetical protein
MPRPFYTAPAPTDLRGAGRFVAGLEGHFQNIGRGRWRRSRAGKGCRRCSLTDGPLPFGGAGEPGEVAVGFHQSLLHQVGGVQPHAQPGADLCPGQQPQVIAVQVQKAPQGAGLTGPGLFQEHLGQLTTAWLVVHP